MDDSKEVLIDKMRLSSMPDPSKRDLYMTSNSSLWDHFPKKEASFSRYLSYRWISDRN